MTEISDWSDLEVQLQETRESLAEIEHRFRQIRLGLQEQQELKAQQEQLKSQLPESAGDRPHSPNSKIRRKPKSPRLQEPLNQQVQKELQEKLQEVNTRLEQIEVEIESRLISWSSLNETFWQIVRFVGIGIVIGVILKSCAN